jgi:ATP-dependent RNA helicase DeaD
MAFTFVSGKEIYQLRDIQRYTKTRIEQQQIPSVHDVREIKTNIFLDKVKNVINNDNLEKEVHIVEKMIEEDYNSVDIAAALLKMTMGAKNPVQSEDQGFGDTGASAGMVRFFINAGRKDRVKAKDIIKTINNKTGLSSTLIGKVDVYDKFSFAEVPEASAGEVLSAMNGSRIKGRAVNMEPAKKRED